MPRRSQGAQLVVINGGHYDEWAAKLAATSAPNAPVVSAVDDDGRHRTRTSGTPRATVTDVADAVTAELTELAPDANDYFAERRAAIQRANSSPTTTLIATIKAHAHGQDVRRHRGRLRPHGRSRRTAEPHPGGYQAAARNETDPSPADLDAFLKLLARPRASTC